MCIPLRQARGCGDRMPPPAGSTSLAAAVPTPSWGCMPAAPILTWREGTGGWPVLGEEAGGSQSSSSPHCAPSGSTSPLCLSPVRPNMARSQCPPCHDARVRGCLPRLLLVPRQIPCLSCCECWLLRVHSLSPVGLPQPTPTEADMGRGGSSEVQHGLRTARGIRGHQFPAETPSLALFPTRSYFPLSFSREHFAIVLIHLGQNPCLRLCF